MKTLPILLLATLAIAMLPGSEARAQQSSPAIAAQLIDDVSIPFDTFTLDNGLRVVVHSDHKTPVVAVALWYEVGSQDEPEGKTGFAHLFEHLMFSGSANAPGEYFEYLKRIGATNYNGTTSYERTNYFETVPTGALETALFLEADRMGHLLEAVTQDKLDRQRGVVQNEMRQGLNRPFGQVDGVQTAALFPAGHPYGHRIVGSMDDLNAASLQDVHQWFRDHYGPNNAILTLSGDIDLATAKRLAAKYFAAIPPSPEQPAAPIAVPTLAAPLARTIHDRVANTRLYRSWVVPGSTDADSVPLSVASWVLGGLTSSRLDTILVRDERLAVHVGAYLRSTPQIGRFEVRVDVKPGVDPAVVAARLDTIMADYIRNGPTEDEIRRVATRLISSRMLQLESVGAKGALLTENMAATGDPGHFRDEWRDYADATPEAVRAVMGKWLTRPVFALTVAPGERDVVDSGVAQTPPPAAPQAAVPEPTAVVQQTASPQPLPPVEPARPFAFPEISRARLSNGIEVVYAQRMAMPITQLELSFDAGHAADIGFKPGTASMASSLLADSSAQLDPVALAQREEELGAIIQSGASTDTSGIITSTPTESLGPVLDLIAEMAERPDFLPASVERQRGQMLAGIASDATSARAVAMKYLLPTIYGATHPYGQPGLGSGSPDTIPAISRDDLIAFHRAWLRPETAKIYVVSNRPLADILPMLESRFGSWQGDGPRGDKALDAPVPQQSARIVLIDRKDAAQAQILAGELLPVRGTDDLLNLETANSVFGGGFISRINLDLRQQKGWTYGASSILPMLIGQKYVVISASVQTDKAGASIAALRSDLENFLGADGVTDAELDRTVTGAVRQLPGHFETSSSLLYTIEENDMMGRPDDYSASLTARYQAMQASDLDSAARQAFDPSRMIWVVVGDAETIRPQLEELGLPIEVVAAP